MKFIVENQQQQAARGVLQLPAQGQPGPRPQISGTRLSASTFPFFLEFSFWYITLVDLLNMIPNCHYVFSPEDSFVLET